jgi:hypothetical protein
LKSPPNVQLQITFPSERHRLAGAPFMTQVRIVFDFVARLPLKNPSIGPPGCVASTSGLDALPGRTATMTAL